MIHPKIKNPYTIGIIGITESDSVTSRFKVAPRSERDRFRINLDEREPTIFLRSSTGRVVAIHDESHTRRVYVRKRREKRKAGFIAEEGSVAWAGLICTYNALPPVPR